MTTPAIALSVNNLEFFYSSLIKSTAPFLADGAPKGTQEAKQHSGSEGGAANPYQWFHYRSLES